MRVIKLTSKNYAEVIDLASDILNKGGIIVYPTDTCYGIGGDATNTKAIEKVYKIKGRDFKSPLNVIFNELSTVEKYGELNDLAREYANKYLPGALTIIINKTVELPDILRAGLKTLAFRIPDDKFCLDLAKKFNKPYITTSANISGQPQAYSIEDLLSQFNDKYVHTNLIDLVIDAGRLVDNPPSTIVEVTDSKPVIIRQGAIKIL